MPTENGTVTPPTSGFASGPTQKTSRTAKYRDAHVWYDADNKDNFTAYKLLICDVVKDKLLTVPRAVMAAGGIMQGARGGIDIPDGDVDRVKSHLAKYYRKMDRTPPWED